ncbi:uncharacterized protein A1O9_07128 [Exophiala aquamarina CBS 119918]|uniref:Zn(2)-C6 fungal-type domain-containing protein n=1 Tax=Exophiala aquamarina CBS 119918 TaxID=1182545 RepID=A0A072PCC1_9EURO|nr:uncharacterized protein A1O9_07128 [Exophiala aquamarina CBS 119918]KEF56938.1 hypothetical protein A1O9_07128 [Exophiala aquamarina CBS 119918]
MANGIRSRTGCLTCRLRKKKCDEGRPVCQTCHSIELTCYGYNTPFPRWYTDKTNWEEVKNSPEAKALRALAETRYKIRRKFGLKKFASAPDTSNENTVSDDSFQFKSSSTENSVAMISNPSSRAVTTPNVWQLYPETIWWDSALCNLAPVNPSSSRKDIRLLMVFLEVIHPITHGFYQLSSSGDRSWLLSRLVGDQALYHASLSISACFDHSLTQPPKIDAIGICSKVRSLQNIAIHELQTRIHAFVTEERLSLQDFVCAGVQLLDIILSLITLEVFSMLQGHWETHHQAARMLLDYIETYSLSKGDNNMGQNGSPIAYVLLMPPLDDQQRRTIMFCLANFIWVDVIATATFGLSCYTPCAFDYLSLLENGDIKPEHAMGCQGWILASIVEIARLEQRKTAQQTQICMISTTAETTLRGLQLSDKLRSGIERLEKEGRKANVPVASSLEEDSRLVSILWAYAAQIFLQATILEAEHAQPYIDQTFINICLQKLEELPTRLMIRVCWPYTIVGCMASDEFHARFRRIVGRTMEQSQPPGMTWKGLMVMEECWRGQQIHEYKRNGWREAMERLRSRILLV